jgi:hypothetical protein
VFDYPPFYKVQIALRGFGFSVREDMKANATSFSLSWRTSAGLSFVDDRSVNGNGMRTIFPFNCV